MQPIIPQMITYQDALDIVLSHVVPTEAEELEIDQLLGTYLAKSLVASYDMPLFDNSSVDGYGVILSDISQASSASPVSLPISSAIHAGEQADQLLTPGTTLKLFTGAPVPSNVEGVVPLEQVVEVNGMASFRSTIRKSENIRKRGEELLAGMHLLSCGAHVTPVVVGIVAAQGHQSFPVGKKPNVALITTGNELVEPGQSLQPGQVYNSNSYALTAAFKAIGITPGLNETVRDDLEITKARLAHALQTSDIVVTVGGISVGEYDFVKSALESLGVICRFWMVAMKPGKPNFFGTFETPEGKKKLIFGLPGNPVAALLSFHQLVKPAIRKMMGSHAVHNTSHMAVLRKDIAKRGTGRLEFVRGMIDPQDDHMTVIPIKGRESHMLSSLAQSNSLIHFAQDRTFIVKGSKVQVEFLNWFK